jgi:hypothetical protein
MKTFKLLLSILIFFGLVVSLQAEAPPQISIRGEKILVNNQLYGYIIKNGSVWAKDYSFRSKDNVELAYVKAVTRELADGDDYDYYEITFKDFAQKAEMEMETDLGRRLAFEMTLCKIIKDGDLDPLAVEKFLARYPPRISQRLANSTQLTSSDL